MPIPVEIPISKHFSPDRQREVREYLLARVESLVNGLRTIREDKITSWRRVYSGQPREKVKSFPWPNASNLVPQIVGSFCDQLTAKIVMGTIAIDPPWVAELVGTFDAGQEMEDKREAAERWLEYSGLEPSLLNLLPKYVIWIRTFVKYGLGAMKLIPELTVEQVAESVAGRSVTFREHIRHDGPVALPLRFEDFLIPPSTVELERAPIVCQRIVMNRLDMLGLLADDSYKRYDIEQIIKSPDRQGPDPQRQAIETDTGAGSDNGGKVSDEWDLYECYFPYMANGDRFHLIATIHLGTRRMPKAVFNWLPDNSIPYLTARLGSDGERSHGFGFCEMLGGYQEEIAAIHNQRRDASTLANTNLIRAGSGLQLDSQFSVYPNGLITGEQGSIEVIPMGRTGNETIKDEQLVLQEAQDRAGIGPSSTGSSAGTVNKKGGYSAMGAWPVMQEGNTRANLNITEFRQSHYQLGRLKLLYDAHFGIDKRSLRAMAEQGKQLDAALTMLRNGQIILPIRAATGSVNKEIEKQGLMLMLNNVRAHYQQIVQMMQAAANPQAPPEYATYLNDTILASNLLMKRIVREFVPGDPSAILPDPMGIKQKSAQAHAQGGGQPQPGAQPQLGAGGDVPQPQGQGMPQPQAAGAPEMPVQ